MIEGHQNSRILWILPAKAWGEDSCWEARLADYTEHAVSRAQLTQHIFEWRESVLCQRSDSDCPKRGEAHHGHSSNLVPLGTVGRTVGHASRLGDVTTARTVVACECFDGSQRKTCTSTIASGAAEGS